MCPSGYPGCAATPRPKPSGGFAPPTPPTSGCAADGGEPPTDLEIPQTPFPARCARPRPRRGDGPWGIPPDPLPSCPGAAPLACTRVHARAREGLARACKSTGRSWRRGGTHRSGRRKRRLGDLVTSTPSHQDAGGRRVDQSRSHRAWRPGRNRERLPEPRRSPETSGNRRIRPQNGDSGLRGPNNIPQDWPHGRMRRSCDPWPSGESADSRTGPTPPRSRW